MDACRAVLENPQLQTALIVGFYAVDKAVEYWLGKTEYTKAGSIAELVINLFKRSTEDQKND